MSICVSTAKWAWVTRTPGRLRPEDCSCRRHSTRQPRWAQRRTDAVSGRARHHRYRQRGITPRVPDDARSLGEDAPVSRGPGPQGDDSGVSLGVYAHGLGPTEHHHHRPSGHARQQRRMDLTADVFLAAEGASRRHVARRGPAHPQARGSRLSARGPRKVLGSRRRLRHRRSRDPVRPRPPRAPGRRARRRECDRCALR